MLQRPVCHPAALLQLTKSQLICRCLPPPEFDYCQSPDRSSQQTYTPMHLSNLPISNQLNETFFSLYFFFVIILEDTNAYPWGVQSSNVHETDNGIIRWFNIFWRHGISQLSKVRSQRWIKNSLHNIKVVTVQ